MKTEHSSKKDAYCPVCGAPAWRLYKLGTDGRYSLLVGYECPRCGDCMLADPVQLD